MKRPNIVFVFADQWRGQATGYAGDPNCLTPNLDRLAGQSIDFPHAVSGCPVCCPYRASLMTGQYPLTHGVIINDVELNPGAVSMARVLASAGYRTAYIGKWHLYGSPDGHYGRRAAPVPRQYQLGFEDWRGFECSHDYNHSFYYHNEDPRPHPWEGYDAFAQSRAAAETIDRCARGSDPFLLMLSWGPPHDPLDTAPEPYRALYANRELRLRPNVPAACRHRAQEDLRGYYAHIAALDDALAGILKAIREAGIEDDTLMIFTSDHGDMMQSQGLATKLYPWEESIRVPFLLRWPRLHGARGGVCHAPIDAPDILPTLLGLCGLPIPDGVEGRDWSPEIRGEPSLKGDEAALLTMPVAFTQLRLRGMKPYRGLRTLRHTYVRTADGPWLLYDLADDPFQMRNLASIRDGADVRARLDRELERRLRALNDPFEPEEDILRRAGLSHYGEVRVAMTEPWSDPWVSAEAGGSVPSA